MPACVTLWHNVNAIFSILLLLSFVVCTDLVVPCHGDGDWEPWQKWVPAAEGRIGARKRGERSAD